MPKNIEELLVQCRFFSFALFLVCTSSALGQTVLPKDDGTELRARRIPAQTTQIGEGWTMQLTMGSGVDSQANSATLSRALDAIGRSTGRSPRMPKRLAVNSVEVDIPSSTTRRDLQSLYRSVLGVDGIDSVRVRSSLKAQYRPTDAELPDAIGLIVKPYPSHMPGETADAKAPSPNVAEISALTGIPFAEALPLAGGMFALRFPTPVTGIQAAAIARSAAQSPELDWVEVDALDHHNRVPNDSFFNLQWNMAAGWGINGPQAWDLTTGIPSVVVAVIDTGVVKTQPDLIPKLVGGYDFISDPSSARDGDGLDADASDEGTWAEIGECGTTTFKASNWHGTHVAGIVGAATDNEYGVAGVAWGARILPVRVLGKCGRGSRADVINGMYWAAGLPVPGVPPNPNPARILNMSLGSAAPSPFTCTNDFATAVNAVRTAGAIVVAAAGNNKNETVFYQPAGCDGVVTVAASDHLGFRASYSNFSEYFAVDLSAPGGDEIYYGVQSTSIYSTVDAGTRGPVAPFGGYMDGTSMAAPHVAGILALMLSANPSLSNSQLIRTLIETTKDFNSTSGCFRDSVCGWGIADAHRALLRATTDPANQWTSIAIASSQNPSVYGTAFTLTATVTPSNVTGTVTFLHNNLPLAGCTDLTTSNGSAVCQFNNWSVNLDGYKLSATFNGDYTHRWDRSETLAQIVLPAAPAPAPAGQSNVSEFFHPQFNHYFITADANEAAFLTAGKLPPWAPTGRTFKVWTVPGVNITNVCRFFSAAFAPRSSHFYSGSTVECPGLAARGTWTLESANAFYMMPTSSGACPSGTRPLYRLYNDGMSGAPNHRYTIELTVRSSMIGSGWIPEGNGSAGVFACVPL